jgi:glucan endo-1,3-alpha-glucosidase
MWEVFFSIRRKCASIERVVLTAIVLTSCFSIARAEGVGHHYVFAHYMACCPRGGHSSSVAEYGVEIAEAAEAGIDGFAVNLGAWNSEPYYQVIVERIFDAADEVGNFKLFFSFDNLGAEEAISVLERFRGRKSYLMVDDQPVVSTYGEDATWAAQVREAFTAERVYIKLIPSMYYPRIRNEKKRDVAVTSESEIVSQVLEDIPTLYGYFYFGAGAPYEEIVASIKSVIVLLHNNDKVAMVGISPYYKGFANNSRVFESDGFVGMRAEWLAAIENHADWIELVTWNDWGEATYIESFGAPSETKLWNFAWGPLLDHSAFLAASKYYIRWFKSGSPPAIRDEQLFYFFRLHPKSAIGDTWPAKKILGRPTNWERLHDGIYFAYYLQAPVSIVITDGVGSSRYRVELEAGAGVTKMPLVYGDLYLCVYRGGQLMRSKGMEQAITRRGERGNFNYFSGMINLKKQQNAVIERSADEESGHWCDERVR